MNCAMMAILVVMFALDRMIKWRPKFVSCFLKVHSVIDRMTQWLIVLFVAEEKERTVILFIRSLTS